MFEVETNECEDILAARRKMKDFISHLVRYASSTDNAKENFEKIKECGNKARRACDVTK